MAQGSGEVGATSDEIRSQIEQTRGEMSSTIDAIQSRLSPKRVLVDAKDSVTEATVERVRRLTSASRGVVLQKMHDRRVPIALLAAAAGLLVRSMTNRRRGRPRRRKPVTAPVQQPGAKRAWSASDRISRERRSAGRLLAAAGAGAACWGIWRAQTATTRFGSAPR
jgi:hypothetical protein